MSIPKLKIIIDDLTHKSKVYLDDEVIGLIQNVKVELDVKELFPKVEITFPDLFDERYIDSSKELTTKLAYNMSQLCRIPNVTVKLKSLYDVDTE